MPTTTQGEYRPGEFAPWAPAPVAPAPTPQAAPNIPAVPFTNPNMTATTPNSSSGWREEDLTTPAPAPSGVEIPPTIPTDTVQGAVDGQQQGINLQEIWNRRRLELGLPELYSGRQKALEDLQNRQAQLGQALGVENGRLTSTAIIGGKRQALEETVMPVIQSLQNTYNLTSQQISDIEKNLTTEMGFVQAQNEMDLNIAKTLNDIPEGQTITIGGKQFTGMKKASPTENIIKGEDGTIYQVSMGPDGTPQLKELAAAPTEYEFQTESYEDEDGNRRSYTVVYNKKTGQRVSGGAPAGSMGGGGAGGSAGTSNVSYKKQQDIVAQINGLRLEYQANPTGYRERLIEDLVKQYGEGARDFVTSKVYTMMGDSQTVKESGIEGEIVDSKTGRPLTKPLPEATYQYIVDRKQLLDQAGKVAGLMSKLGSTGAVKGYILKEGIYWPVVQRALNADETELMSEIFRLNNAYVYAVSGKQINEQEFARLSKATPNIVYTKDVNERLIKNFQRYVGDNLKSYMDARGIKFAGVPDGALPTSNSGSTSSGLTYTVTQD